MAGELRETVGQSGEKRTVAEKDPARRVFGMVEIDSGVVGEGLHQRESAARLVVEAALTIPTKSGLGNIPVEAVMAGNSPEAPLELQIATAWFVARKAVAVLRDGEQFDREEGVQLVRGSLATEVTDQLTRRLAVATDGGATDPYGAWRKLDGMAGIITPLSGGLTGREFRDGVRVLTQAGASAGAQRLMGEIQGALELNENRELGRRSLDLIEQAILDNVGALSAREKVSVKAAFDQATEDALPPAPPGPETGGPMDKATILDAVLNGREIALHDRIRGDLRSADVRRLLEGERRLVEAAVHLAAAADQKKTYGVNGGIPDADKQQGEPRILEIKKEHLRVLLEDQRFVQTARTYLLELLFHRKVAVPGGRPGDGVRLREASNEEFSRIRNGRRTAMAAGRDAFLGNLVEPSSWNLVFDSDFSEDSRSRAVFRKVGGRDHWITEPLEIDPALLERCRDRRTDPEVIGVRLPNGEIGSVLVLDGDRYRDLRDNLNTVSVKEIVSDAVSVPLIKLFHPLTFYGAFKARMGAAADWVVDKMNKKWPDGEILAELEKCYPSDTGKDLLIYTKLPTTRTDRHGEPIEKSLVEIILGQAQGDYVVAWDKVMGDEPFSLRIKKAQLALLGFFDGKVKEIQPDQQDLDEKILDYERWGERIGTMLSRALRAAGEDVSSEMVAMIMRAQLARSYTETLDLTFVTSRKKGIMTGIKRLGDSVGGVLEGSGTGELAVNRFIKGLRIEFPDIGDYLP